MRLQTHPPQSLPERQATSLSWRATWLTALALAAAWLAGWAADFRLSTLMAISIAIVLCGIVGAAVHSALRRKPELVGRPDALPFAASRPLDESRPTPFSESLHGKRWSLDVFKAIDAGRFAAVCETWFSWAGFETRLESHRTDEGVDIWLHAPKMPGPVAIVRCRHWLDKPVGLQEMKEFVQVMASFKSVHGTYTTTSTYTPEALQFAKEHGIDAVDGRGLLRRFQTRTQQRQQALLAIAINGAG